MNKNNDNKLIPRLRFPEFRDNGEWEKECVGNLFKFKQGVQVPIEKQFPNKTNEMVRFIRIIDITSSSKSFRYIYNPGNEQLIGTNDLFMVRYGTPGLISIGYEGVIANNLFRIIWKYNDLYLPKFWFYIFQKIEKLIYGLSSSSSMPAISFSTMDGILLAFPKNPKEQQKIAACLSSLDEVITAESQKLELLKEHKKGLLQNLFPQEGETVPKLRFKEFEDCGEWEEKTLGEVYEFKTTNSFSRDFLNYQKGTVKNIHYGDIHTKFNTLFDITKENVPFINSDVPIEKIKEDCYCQEGDMIFADASEDLNDIGKSIEVVNLNDEKLVSGLHTILARQKVRLLQIGFGGYLFKSGWIRKQIQKESQGAKVFGISASRISGIKIKFPSDLTEQQKIAACLSSLDDLINAQSQKIETLKLHKKGLLQGLFPTINNEE